MSKKMKLSVTISLIYKSFFEVGGWRLLFNKHFHVHFASVAFSFIHLPPTSPPLALSLAPAQKSSESISSKNFVIPAEVLLCIHKTKSISSTGFLILQWGKSISRDEEEEKNEAEIITRAQARITTRTGEIPLLIPDLSGCCWCHFLRAYVHGYMDVYA